MRILMTNADLLEIGGTQTWTKTIAKAFSDDGHDVEFIATQGRTISQDVPSYYDRELSKLGPIATDLDGFNLAIVNHSIAFPHIKEKTGAFCIFMCHGPNHSMEVPAGGGDAYICVSEEIQKRYAPVFPDMMVLRQPVDLEEFKPKPYDTSWMTGGPEELTEEPNELVRVFVNCKNKGAMQRARAACVDAGYAFDFIHYQDRPNMNPSRLMSGFDIAITSGRGIVEAMACGLTPLIYRADIVARHNQDFMTGITADGWINEDNVEDFATVNYSGRFHSHDWDVGDLTEALFSYKPCNMRPWVEEHHDSKKIAAQLVGIMERVPA